MIERLAVARQDRLARILGIDRQMVSPDRQDRAGRQSHEVVRVWHRVGFVEVVDAPDEASLRVPPGAEVLDMQVADAERRRGGGQLRADLRPALDPAVERRPQERERAFRHPLVLQLHVGGDERKPLAEPCLIGFGCFVDVHDFSSPRHFLRRA